MKKLMKFLSLTVFMLMLAISSMAQKSATATVQARLVTPITIEKLSDMSFGNVASNGDASTLVISPEGIRTAGTGITLPNVTGTVTAARFEVSGMPTYTFVISIPTTTVNVKSTTNATDVMTVTNFTLSTTGSTDVLSALGKCTFTVGGTLNIGPLQNEGLYNSTNPLVVTVNYN